MSNYKKTMSKIHATDDFKSQTLQLIEQNMTNERRNNMTIKRLMVAVAACMVVAVGMFGFNQMSTNDQVVEVNLLDRMTIDREGPGGKAIVNIEGTITELGQDGLSFKLDNGTWVSINDETELGIHGTTAAPKEEQFFEPTFRVGNSIAGFTLDEGDKVVAFAIYTNWNWDDPIR